MSNDTVKYLLTCNFQALPGGWRRWRSHKVVGDSLIDAGQAADPPLALSIYKTGILQARRNLCN